MATELAADAPTGLTVTAPEAGAYFKMRSLNAVRLHGERSHHVQVYVFPSSEIEREERTRGTTYKSQPQHFEMTVAVRLAIEAGNIEYDNDGAYWKELSPYERETERCDVLIGAIQDCIDGYVRNADDVNHVFFEGADVDEDRFKRSADDRSELWGSVRFRVHQIVRVPVQNT